MSVLMFLWMLPQNVLGLILRCVYKGEDIEYKDAKVRVSNSMLGGISLGRYIIVNKTSQIRHEYGHCIQSKYLGWLYLLVIGLPSIVWAMVYGSIIPRTADGYYRFYTEKWAERLVGKIR